MLSYFLPYSLDVPLCMIFNNKKNEDMNHDTVTMK